MIPRTRLQAVPFFAAFPRPALKVLADRAIERRFATAETIFRAGESSGGLLVVLEGKVRVVRRAGGRAQVVHVERVGGTLGEVPLFAGGGYPATAIAAEPTVCAQIDRPALMAAVRSVGPGRFEIVDAPALRARAGDDVAAPSPKRALADVGLGDVTRRPADLEPRS